MIGNQRNLRGNESVNFDKTKRTIQKVFLSYTDCQSETEQSSLVSPRSSSSNPVYLDATPVRNRQTDQNTLQWKIWLIRVTVYERNGKQFLIVG